MANFRKGGEAAKEAAERQGGGFDRVGYFSLKDKERATVRFITEEVDWLTVAMHNGVPTRPAPPNFKGNWPAVMSAVCRLDKAFEGAYEDCFICKFLKDKWDPSKAFKRPDRTWGFLIMREEIMADSKLVGIKDVLKEIKGAKEGDPVRHVPDIRVATMAYSNFWGSLQGMAAMNDTVRDRDYRITRVGGGTDTVYQFGPHKQIGVEVEIDGVKTVVPYDLRDSRFMDVYDVPDLGEMIDRQASDDHYDLFFDTRHHQPVRNADATPDGPAQPVPETPGIAPDALAAMAGRIAGYGGQIPQPQIIEQQTPLSALASGFLNG